MRIEIGAGAGRRSGYRAHVRWWSIVGAVTAIVIVAGLLILAGVLVLAAATFLSSIIGAVIGAALGAVTGIPRFVGR